MIEVNANVLLCRDDENIIELYYGPFLEDEIRDNLLSKLIKNGFKEAYSLEMRQKKSLIKDATTKSFLKYQMHFLQIFFCFLYLLFL